jgi:hypothetical protein
MELVTVSTTLVPATVAFEGQQPYDLVALSSVKADLGITDPAFDTLFYGWISQASAAASNFCNRVFPVETVQDQIFPPRDYFPAPTVIGGVKPLQLTRWPITSTVSTAGTRPPVAPTLTAIAGGSLAAAKYFVRISYVTPAGETAASLEVSLSLAANTLLQVASPPADSAAIATGWNCYIGTTSFGETLQNASPLAIGSSFTLPTSGLIAGTALPKYLLAIENNIPLAEGVDFITKADVGQLVRLDSNGWPKRWPALITLVQYSAGYSLTDTKFADAVDAVIRMVRNRWFSRSRDSRLRSENIPGAYEATWWFASGPGAAVGNLTPDIEALLEKYRVPITG